MPEATNHITTLASATSEIFVMIFIALLLGFFFHKLIFGTKYIDTSDSENDSRKTRSEKKLDSDKDAAQVSKEENKSKRSDTLSDFEAHSTAVSLDELFDTSGAYKNEEIKDTDEIELVSDDSREFIMVSHENQDNDLEEDLDEDDLKIVEGVGPKIEEVLKESGITTWKSLANTEVDQLRDILKNAGERFLIHDPSTWSRQAQLAYDGEWDELEEFQDKLVGGRE